MTTARAELSQRDIARLARVKNAAVVSTWRNRFADGETAFPSPINPSGELRFDADQVANWLVETGHGNNPAARDDVAAFAQTSLETTPDVIEALLALVAIDGEPASTGDIRVRAHVSDPTDAFIARELSGGIEPEVRAHVDELIDASYTPASAYAAAGHNSPSPFTEPAAIALAALLSGIAHDPSMPAFTITPRTPVSVVTRMQRALATSESQYLLNAPDASRAARRAALTHGCPAGSLMFDSLAELPSATLTYVQADDTDSALAQVEDFIDELPASGRALIVAPHRMLTGTLSKSLEDQRAAILRGSRVRAIVRLPDGMLRDAPRVALSVWAIGAPQSSPADERFVLTGDLRGAAFDEKATTALALDLVASFEGWRVIAARSFEFLQFERLHKVVPRSGDLVQPRQKGTREVDVFELIARADAAARQLGIEIPSLAAEAATRSAPLATLIADGDVAMRSGVRLSVPEAARGHRVIGEPELRSESWRYVDPFDFAARHPKTRLSERGDVVYVAGPNPAAVVDYEGGSVVQFPARILRLKNSTLLPEAVASDINAVGRRAPRDLWLIRRIRSDAREEAADMLARLRAERDALVARAHALSELADTVTDALCAGATFDNTAPERGSNEKEGQ